MHFIYDLCGGNTAVRAKEHQNCYQDLRQHDVFLQYHNLRKTGTFMKDTLATADTMYKMKRKFLNLKQAAL